MFQKINSTAGDIYAKQDSGNLQLIGDWFNHVNAKLEIESELLGLVQLTLKLLYVGWMGASFLWWIRKRKYF